MFDFNIIIERLNDLSNWKNSVIANSKKIFQLPIATAGVKKVAVYNENSLVTEQFNLTDALNGFNLLNDKITAYGTISRVANVFTYSVGYEWILGGLNYANTTDIDITVNDATDGFFRIDIVVVDTNNQIYLIEGFESDSVATQPEKPDDTLLLDTFNIFGDVIDNPLPYPNLNLTSENFGQFIDLLPYKGTIIDDDKLIIGNSEESGKAFYTKAISFAEYLIIKLGSFWEEVSGNIQNKDGKLVVVKNNTTDLSRKMFRIFTNSNGEAFYISGNGDVYGNGNFTIGGLLYISLIQLGGIAKIRIGGSGAEFRGNVSNYWEVTKKIQEVTDQASTYTDLSLVNKKYVDTPKLQTVTSSATVTPTSINDIVTITAQSTGLTLANPKGAFAEGQSLMIRIKDNGTARSITFGSNYRAIGITLPTTTVISKTLYLGIIYNGTDSKWDILGINQEA